jgi:alginate O-acetyltransferase complex protein AlgJ
MYVGALATLLLLPLVQMQVRIVPVPALRGVQQPVCFPRITLPAIRHGDIQSMAEKWFARNFGLRELWIRLHNQMLYSFLRVTPSESTIEVGRHGQLFEKNYLEYYLGLKNAPVDSMVEYIGRLKHLQQLLLRRYGIPLIVCISPSKAAFVPEDIPSFYKSAKRKSSTAYRLMMRLLLENGIPFVDGPALLCQHRNDYSAPLMARCSSHWNSIGAFYSADRFIAVAESLNGATLVHPAIQSVVIDSCPISNDRELANLMNLFWTPTDFPVMHATFGQNSTGMESNVPRLLVEGGSFNWIWLDVLFFGQCLESTDFCYYYSKPYAERYSYRADKEKEKVQSDVDWEKTICNIDILVIEINESLMMFPVEFVQDMTQYLEKSEKLKNRVTFCEPLQHEALYSTIKESSRTEHGR